MEGTCHWKTHGQTQRASHEKTEHVVTQADIREAYLQIKQHTIITENRKDGFPPTGFKASVATRHADLNLEPAEP